MSSESSPRPKHTIVAQIKKAEARRVDPLTSEKVEDSRLDRKLRGQYAYWMIGILIGQLLLLNVVFILSGSNVLSYSDLTIQIFMGATLAEIFGVIVVITRYLFPGRSANG